MPMSSFFQECSVCVFFTWLLSEQESYIRHRTALPLLYCPGFSVLRTGPRKKVSKPFPDGLKHIRDLLILIFNIYDSLGFRGIIGMRLTLFRVILRFLGFPVYEREYVVCDTELNMSLESRGRTVWEFGDVTYGNIFAWLMTSGAFLTKYISCRGTWIMPCTTSRSG